MNNHINGELSRPFHWYGCWPLVGSITKLGSFPVPRPYPKHVWDYLKQVLIFTVFSSQFLVSRIKSAVLIRAYFNYVHAFLRNNDKCPNKRSCAPSARGKHRNFLKKCGQSCSSLVSLTFSHIYRDSVNASALTLRKFSRLKTGLLMRTNVGPGCMPHCTKKEGLLREVRTCQHTAPER